MDTPIPAHSRCRDKEEPLPTGHMSVEPDIDQLHRELQQLAKGRALEHGDLLSRVQPLVGERAGIRASDTAVDARRRLVEWVANLAGTLPQHMQRAANAAFALGEFANVGVLADRVEAFASASGYSSRTARRRIAEAISLLAEVSARQPRASSSVQALDAGKNLRPYADSRPVLWPHQVGVVPALAAGYQSRPDVVQPTLLIHHAHEARALVLSGLGGAGKTQLAAECAWRLWNERAIELMVWVRAESRDRIVSAYAQAAEEIVGTQPEASELAATRFLAWLASTNRRWLVVLDDLQMPSDLAGLWPPESSQGLVIVTTRRRDAALSSHGTLLNVSTFSPDLAEAYLVDRLGDPGLLKGADALAADLGYLPVALAQAAAYMLDRHLPCDEYRARLGHQRNKLASLLPETHALPDDHRMTFNATWALSIKLADELSPVGLARPLLDVLSVLSSDGIPLRLLDAPALVAYSDKYRESNTDQAEPVDSEDVRDALFCLQRVNLVYVEAEGELRIVRMHALVQRATREQLTADRLGDAVAAAAEALMLAWDSPSADGRDGVVLRANAMALHRSGNEAIWRSGKYHVLFRAGTSLGNAGHVRAAVRYWSEIKQAAVQYLGADHPDTLLAEASLALWTGAAGDVSDAVEAYQDLIGRFDRVFGHDHPRTLATRQNFASWRGEAGDPVGAAIELEHLLVDQLRVLGPDHPDTLTTRHNLALWRGQAGDAASAAAAFDQLLADLLRVLGPDHPDTLTTRHNLALWRGQAGDAASAAASFEQLLADRLRVLGGEHPHTLATRDNLATSRGRAGDPAGAAALLEQLLADRLRVLGPDHPDTLTTRHNLALWRGQAGDAASAAAAFDQLLADRRRVLGGEHPDTLATMRSLANLYEHEGRIEAALRLIEEALTAAERVYGVDHPRTLILRKEADDLRKTMGDSRRTSKFVVDASLARGVQIGDSNTQYNTFN